jgi:hypothetical protein
VFEAQTKTGRAKRIRMVSKMELKDNGRFENIGEMGEGQKEEKKVFLRAVLIRSD